MDEPEYYPLVDTFRLYAGWLLACLSVIFIAGSYQQLRHLPVHFSLLDEWMDSSMILRVTFGTFLFLLLSTLHRTLGRGTWKGLLLTIIGFLCLALFLVNS